MSRDSWSPRTRSGEVRRGAGADPVAVTEIECRGCQGLGAPVVSWVGNRPVFETAGRGDRKAQQRAKRMGVQPGQIVPCEHCGGTGWIRQRQGAEEGQ